MKIKRVECRQFAGLVNQEKEFHEGLNLVVGENESGKSTMVDLICYLLFKGVKLDGRKDAEFIDKYFPKKVKGPQGDVMDGTLTFETGNGIFQLLKEWEKKQGFCSLVMPDKTSIRSADEVYRILAEELQHGAGIFQEIVFVSRKRQQNMVESIMKKISGKKDERLSMARAELTSAVTQAVLETGGVSLEKLETQLEAMLVMYGEDWDFEADLPRDGAKRGISHKWNSALTKDAKAGKKAVILRAYYIMKEMEKAQSDAEDAEKRVEIVKAQIRAITEKKKAAEERRKDFQKYRSVLGQISLLKSRIMEQQHILKEQEAALQQWPGYERDIQAANLLKKKLEQAKVHALYSKIEKIQREYEEYKKKLACLIPVNPEDIRKIRKHQQEQAKLEAQISGLNLTARIRQLGSQNVEIRAAATGDRLPVMDGTIAITEAVEIKVPGIFEMELMPKGTDLDEVKRKLYHINQEITSIFAEYQVESMEELEHQQTAYESLRRKVEILENNLTVQLGRWTWEALQQAEAEIPGDIGTEEEIKFQIEELCKTRSLEGFIGALESWLQQYRTRYGSEEQLENSILQLKTQLQKYQERYRVLNEVPEEYGQITDAEEYNAKLENQAADYEAQLGRAAESLREAEMNLGEKSAEEYTEEWIQAEAEFQEKKAVYGHWKHIYEEFRSLKESFRGNPMQDVEEKFREYLAVISDDQVSLLSMDDQMAVELASGSHALTYDILSDGTRETVSLAFRLAMLEHLYPEGGGLAVFDDPFTDMDPGRTEQSCRLIEKYAENNQVIFITCDEKYLNMMSGHVIRM